MFGTSAAAVGTVDHDLHRHRRSGLNPFFSKKQISQLEPRVSYHVDKLVGRLRGLDKSGKAVNLVDAFTALTADLISDLAYGQTYNFLSHEDFNPKWHKFMMELSRNTHLMKQVPVLYSLLELLPRALVSFIHPITRQLFALQDSIATQIRIAQSHEGNEKQTPSSANWCMLDSLLSSSHLAPQDKAPYRLGEEALTLLGAGTVTTAWTLSVTCYHLLANPQILGTVQEELRTLPSGPTWTDYESLPYLSAIINEGLRLSHGTSHRLARISPHISLQYGLKNIPAGTPVSMTQLHMHLDSSIFPSPESFIPERWLLERSSEEEVRERRRCLVPFSKGSRMCVGMNLAYAELFVTIARLFRPGGVSLELLDTTEVDVRVERDWFNPVPWQGSKGVRVLVN
jgi:cytochrome P450